VKDGLYAGMWNRQREAEMAREILADADEPSSAPNRNPPPPHQEDREPDLLPAADAAE
jgi:ATP-binding cassette, subfamily B, heavy metal transporter